MAHVDGTKRFSDRVEDYVKYRPSYPNEAIEYLQTRGLDSRAVVADIGSGTGKLTRRLFPHAGLVYGVEPNDAMREKAEDLLQGVEDFVSVAGTAEATGLADASIDMVVVAQAFHWFDREAAFREFRRILTGPRMLVLIWNRRLRETPFLASYEKLLEAHATDYREVNHQRISDDELADLFLMDYEKREFENEQRFDLESLKGRLLSSSYTPKPGEPGHADLFQGIERLFNEHQENGRVCFKYSTEVYSGRVRPRRKPSTASDPCASPYSGVSTGARQRADQSISLPTMTGMPRDIQRALYSAALPPFMKPVWPLAITMTSNPRRTAPMAVASTQA